MKKGNLLYILMLLFNSIILYSQEIKIIDIDSSMFPKLKSNFFVFDNEGKVIKIESKNELKLRENSIDKEILSMTCFDKKTDDSLSICVGVDVTLSMSFMNLKKLPIDLAKSSLNMINSLLNYNKDELAILELNEDIKINTDFQDIKLVLENSINKINIKGIDFNISNNLLNSENSLIKFISNVKNKKIVIFITDGFLDTLNEKDVNEIIKFCKEKGISFNSLILNNQNSINKKILNMLYKISFETGGKLFPYLNDEVLCKLAVYEIIGLLKNKPCEIEWESNQLCFTESVFTEIEYGGKKGTKSYLLPKNIKNNVFISPSQIKILNKPTGIKFDTLIKVKADIYDLEITNVVISNPLFTLNKNNFFVKKGDSLNLTLSYNNNLPINQFCSINLFTNTCNYEIYVSVNYDDAKNSILKINQPNNNEKYAVGEDTIITWKGILPNESVKIEYSTDAGVNWDLLTQNGIGNEYKWKNIPNTPSNECLAKVSTYDDKILPSLEWQKCFGGSSIDFSLSGIQTTDSCCITFGKILSQNGDGDIKNDLEYKVIGSATKYDKYGNILWVQYYDYGYLDVILKGLPTKDGGYLIIGEGRNNFTGKIEFYGDFDIWVSKHDKNGFTEWIRPYGGTYEEFDSKIIETIDGNYVFSCHTFSRDKCITTNKKDTNNSDIWIVKINPKGDIIWNKLIGGSKNDNYNAISNCADGGIILAFTTKSNDGDIINPQKKDLDRDCCIMKLDANGNILWQNIISGNNDEVVGSVMETYDKSYLLVLRTDSPGFVKYAAYDCMVVKYNYQGKQLWKKVYGGSKNDIINSSIETKDHLYLLTGITSSFDGILEGRKYTREDDVDGWLLKIDTLGNFIWQKTFGGTGNDFFYSLNECYDNGYFISGYSDSQDGDVKGKHGIYHDDIWNVKLSKDFLKLQQTDISDSLWSIVYPKLLAINIIDFGKCVAGFSIDSLILNLLKNNSEVENKILKIEILGKDANQFKIPYLKFPINIFPNDCLSLECSFTPTSYGVKSANLLIYTKRDTIPIILTGEGIKPYLQVTNNYIDFGKIFVNSAKDSMNINLIRNIIADSIKIYDIKLSNSTNSDFELLKNYHNYSLMFLQFLSFDIRFKPRSKGRKNDILEVYYEGENSPAKIQLYGEGIPKGATIITQFSSFDTLICENITSEIFIIENTGDERLIINDIKITGDNADEFSSNIKKDIINGRSKKEYQISFNPKSNGLKKANIEIVSNSKENTKLVIPIFGLKENYKVSIIPDFLNLGFISLNKSVDTSITVINLGNIITGIKINKNITLNIPDTSFTLSSNSQAKLKLHYNGSNIPIKIDEFVTITDTYCNKSYDIRIVGEVVDGASGEFVLDTISGKVNDEIELPVKILKGQNIAENGIKFIKFKLTFNKTMLYPLEEPFGTEENNQRVINYEIPYINKIELTKLKYKVCIGNDSITKIKISDIQAVGGELKHTISNGVFKLYDLCYEGGKRLINPDGSMAIKMIKPNPNSESFEIDFEIRENSKTIMQLYTIQGKLINTFFDEYLLQGKYSKTFDIKSIEAGEYMILLKSGIDQDSYKMIKIK